MGSYDATALFPNVPINDAINLVEEKLKNDPTLNKRTKLTPKEIADLMRHCLESSDFLCFDRHHTTKDSGPIGLSLMVVISQLWMLHTFESAIVSANQQKLQAPQNVAIYMDDCFSTMIKKPHRRPGLRGQTCPWEAFNKCLDDVHPRLKFTKELENNNQLPFLDVLITRHDDGTMTTQVYRKPSTTNVLIKPNSCHDPNIHAASFKGEVCRAHRLCTSPDQAKSDIELALNIYEDNGHDREKLARIAKNYDPSKKKTGKNEPKRNKANPPTVRTDADANNEVSNLFSHLPFHISDDINMGDFEFRPFAVLPYVPSISNQLKRIIKKAGGNAFFKSGHKLSSILCSKNRSTTDQMQQKGIYNFWCCKKPYVGQTSRSFSIRSTEHANAEKNSKWAHSGIVQHRQTCKDPFVWKPQILSTSRDKNKKRHQYNLRVEESLWIRRLKAGPGQGHNIDWGSNAKTWAWTPVLNAMPLPGD